MTMKTLELHRAIAGVGEQYSAESINGNTRVYVDSGNFEYEIIKVSETERFKLRTLGLSMVPSADAELLLHIAVKYAKTALKERKPEPLYCVHVVQDVDDSFLTYAGTMYCLGYKDSNLQTQFTKIEIDEMKQNQKLAVDWDKALEEVK